MDGTTCRSIKEARGDRTESSLVGRTEPRGGDGMERHREENLNPEDGQVRMEVEVGAAESPEKGAAPLDSTPGMDDGAEEELFFSTLPQRMVQRAGGTIPLSEGSGDVPPREGQPPQQQTRDFAPEGRMMEENEC